MDGARYLARRLTGRTTVPDDSPCLQRFCRRVAVHPSESAARLPDLWPATPHAAALPYAENSAV